MQLKQLLALSLVIILLLNLVFFAFRKISDLYFWIIIAICGIGAYFVNRWKP